MADLTKLNDAVTANTAAVSDVKALVEALQGSTDQTAIDAAATQVATNTATLVALKPASSAVVVSSISPTSGDVTGGTSVTISGSGFTGATGVTIGGVPATSVVVVSDTTITAVTGASVVGASSVVVTGAPGSNAANTLYTYA